MKLSEAIEEAIEHYRNTNTHKPSATDVRCLINDLIDYDYYKVKGYNQELAWRKVRDGLGTPVR